MKRTPIYILLLLIAAPLFCTSCEEETYTEYISPYISMTTYSFSFTSESETLSASITTTLDYEEIEIQDAPDWCEFDINEEKNALYITAQENTSVAMRTASCKIEGRGVYREFSISQKGATSN